MWEHIIEHHNGYLPLRIKAVPEGTIVATRNVLMTIGNTDPKYAALTTFLEKIREKKSLSDEYNYYESRTLKMFDYSPESIRTKDMTMTTNQQSKRIYLHKNTWIIFTKLLIMDMDMGFYQYTTLNLNYIGNLLNERYYIKRKLGRNPTSNVYFLEKNPNNIDKDDEKHCAIKICTQTKYLFYLNEIKIIQDLKQLNVSNKFHLFFEDIIYIHRQQVTFFLLIFFNFGTCSKVTQ
ncbi:unnamed protein product [Rotaria magnacalcarata]|uniref:Uncharacterized protein n=2 Tax=Rotaria magnacalcarata TaxID=392030 RepID=A0A819U9X7_9BILA|nr:unnamed protein product [Rotaria magnacalcarata]CAF4085605.1 unnamed protein product [Rotaria magnacalcarata]